jgi:tetratricopeptide (TPR) repeat protein
MITPAWENNMPMGIHHILSKLRIPSCKGEAKMKSKKRLVSVLFIVVSLLLVACVAANKEPAAAAIKAAEDAFNAVKGEAMKYVPDQANSVEDAIKIAKANFDKGNFDEALATAKAIPEKVQVLTTAVAAKKTELTRSWEEISSGMPEMLDAIKDKLDILSASKKLPKTMDKAKLEAAKADYEAAAKMWDEAKSTFSGGNMANAIAKAKTVKEKAVGVMNNLGMQVQEAPLKS